MRLINLSLFVVIAAIFLMSGLIQGQNVINDKVVEQKESISDKKPSKITSEQEKPRATSVSLEEFIPMPLPQWQPAVRELAAADNKIVSYDLINQATSEVELPQTESMLDSKFIEGMKSILGDNFPEKNGDITPLNFGTLQLLADPEIYPWSVNVKIYMTFPSGNYVGSGILIDGKYVLTAGHCVYEQDGGGAWASSIRVVPAYENGTEHYGDAYAVSLHSWAGWTSSGNFDWDMGYIELDRTVGALTGWHGYGYNDDNGFFTDNTFHNAGYPAESPYDGQDMYYWYGTFDNVLTHILYHDNLGYGGQSGSGTYYIDASSNRYVYGALSHGIAGPQTGHTRINSDRFNSIQTIIAGATPSAVDLVALNVTVEPSPITAGNQLSGMSYVIHNYSSVTWTGTVGLDIYISTNDVISTGDTYLQSRAVTGSIGPKGTVRITSTASLPTIPPGLDGDYWIGIILNIVDNDATNNYTYGWDSAPIHVDPALSPPLLYVNPTDIDLGTLPGGNGFTRSFIVRNDGEELLTGNVSETASWITSLSPTFFSLTASQQQTVAFSGNIPSTPGPFSTTVSVTSNGGNQNVTVHGVVEDLPLLYVNPTDVDLGTWPGGTGFTNNFTVRNDGGGTLSGNVTETADWITSLNPPSFNLFSGSQQSVVFSGNFPSTPGPFSTTVSVTTNGGNQNVTVHGVVEEEPPVLYVNPTDIDLGTLPGDAGFTSSFIVRNDGGGTLSGNVAESASWITSLSPNSFNLTAGQQQTVSFSGDFPLTPGLFNTLINVTSNGGNQNVTVHGVVEDLPVLYVNPLDIDLGTGPGGNGFTNNFIIRNDGGSTLSGNILESAVWITSLSPDTVSLNSGQTETITFSGNFPSAPGPFSTSINVISNGGVQDVAVHGVVEGGALEHFTYVVDPTGRTQPVYVRDALLDGEQLQPGDEVGVFDGDLLVGAAKIQALPMADPITVYLTYTPPGGDPLPGAQDGNDMLFKVWDQSGNTEYPANITWASPDPALFSEGLIQSVDLSSSSMEHFTYVVDPTGRTQPVYITDALLDGEQLQSGDEVGVFDGDLLVGAAKLSALPMADPITVYLTYTPPGGDPLPGALDGNEMLFKIWDQSADREECANILEVISGEPIFAEGAIVALSLQAPCEITQTINILPNLLNLISFYVNPVDPSAIAVFDPLPNFVIAQDDDGNVRIPPDIVFPGHPGSNTIDATGGIKVEKGYNVYISGDGEQILEVTGLEVDLSETVIPILHSKLNKISFPSKDLILIMDVFSSTINQHVYNDLSIVQDHDGYVYIPPDIVFPGHPGSNTIDANGGMQPGKGYSLYHSNTADLNFIYPEAAGGAVLAKVPGSVEKELPQHYTCTKTGEAHAMFLKNMNVQLEEGDELGVFADGICVGSKRYVDDLNDPLIIWCAIPDCDLDGVKDGDNLEVRLWRSNSETIEILELDGDVIFSKERAFSLVKISSGMKSDGVQLVSDMIPTEMDLRQNYPNPFNPTTTINFSLSSASDVNLLIYNIQGKMVKQLVSGYYSAGVYNVDWDGRNENGSQIVIWNVSLYNESGIVLRNEKNDLCEIG